MHPTGRVSAELLRNAQKFLAGDHVPIPPRSAATVLLLRQAKSATHDVGDRGGGLEVYVLRRHQQMAFAAGMYAFPGGAVDPRDADHEVAWAGPTPALWGARMQCEEPEARALVCAAVRETFEESGVLFAGTTADSIVTDTTSDDWERDRVALIDRSLSLADFLNQRSLVLRADLLGLWAHWITPEFEPRRYDTRFFVAALPAGQVTRDVSGEADRVAWLSPPEALAGVDQGSMQMLPPTYVTISELSRFTSPDEVLASAAERVVQTILPTVEVVDGTAHMTWPSAPAPGSAGNWPQADH